MSDSRTWLGGTSPGLLTLVERSLRWYRDATAVVDGDKTQTFAELDDRSARLAVFLLQRSRERNGRVGVLLSNRAEFVEVDVAILRAGRARVAINPWLGMDERRHILDDSGAEILVTEAAFVEEVLAFVDDLPRLQHIIVVDGGASDAWEDYTDVLQAADGPLPEVVVRATDPSLIIYTSGTTGRPKGATWTFGSRLAAARNMLGDELQIDHTDGMIHVGPVSHGSGSKIVPFIIKGARNIVLPRFDPELFVQAVQRDGGTVSFMVPTMIARLISHAELDLCKLEGLRQISYGGAPMPIATIDAAVAAIGPVFVQVYGSSEAPHPVTVLTRGDHARGHVGHTGREVVGVEVSLRDPSSGAVVADGQPGEMWVRGGNVMSGYWGQPEMTAQVLTDGWYRTGDIARRGENGYLTIIDRLRDLIISGGMNVYPAEVERVLGQHPSVEAVSVVGIPDGDLGEAVTAFVVASGADAATEEELVDFAREHLAGYKKPRRVWFVDELPKGSTGKISKAALRDQVTGAASGT